MNQPAPRPSLTFYYKKYKPQTFAKVGRLVNEDR